MIKTSFVDLPSFLKASSLSRAHLEIIIALVRSLLVEKIGSPIFATCLSFSSFVSWLLYINNIDVKIGSLKSNYSYTLLSWFFARNLLFDSDFDGNNTSSIWVVRVTVRVVFEASGSLFLALSLFQIRTLI